MAFKLDLPAPTESKALASWCVRQLQRVAGLWEGDVESVTFRVLKAAPTQTRPGMVVIVGATLGAEPAFGAGQGMYRRNEANGAWVFVG